MPAAIPAIIGGGVALFGASQQAKQARRTARSQQEVAQQALSEEQRRFEQQFAAGAPFRAAGQQALGQLQSGVDIDSPFFQQRLGTETEALRSQLAASGQLRGGRGLRAISDLTRSLTEQETQRRVGDLLSIARLGAGVGAPGGGVNVGPLSSAIGAGGEAAGVLPSALRQFGEQLPEFLTTLGAKNRPSLFGQQQQNLAAPRNIFGRIEDLALGRG